MRQAMKHFSKVVLLALGFGIFSVLLLSVFDRAPVVADDIKTVVVGNTPLPVTGSVNANVAGNVNANITNAAVPVIGTVAVSSLPPVTLSGSSAVSVTSSSSAPVFVDVDGPSRRPYQQTCDNGADQGATSNGCFLPIVPSGTRLVVDSISMHAAVASSVKLETMKFSPAFGNDSLFFGPAVSANATGNQYSLTQTVSFYLEAGAQPDCAAFFDSALDAGNGFTCEVTGHLVTLP